MRDMRSTGRRTAMLLAILTLMFLAGCSGGLEARFVDDNRDYTLAEVGENAAAVQAGAAARVKVEDAPEARQRVLAQLRGGGDAAAEAADMLTTGFPTDIRAVPFYVEAAAVDGKASWIVIETWGGRSGTLGFRRLWVLDRTTGDITDSRTFR